MVYKLDINAYLLKIYIFFSFRIKVGSGAVSGSEFFCSAEPDLDLTGKIRILIPEKNTRKAEYLAIPDDFMTLSFPEPRHEHWHVIVYDKK